MLAIKSYDAREEKFRCLNIQNYYYQNGADEMGVVGCSRVARRIGAYSLSLRDPQTNTKQPSMVSKDAARRCASCSNA